MSDNLRERVARAMKAASQMRLALAGQVSFDTAAYAWDVVAEDADAALAEMGGGKVRELIWEHSRAGLANFACDTAITPFGSIDVVHYGEGSFGWSWCFGKGNEATPGAAKASAQADYEARILAALEPAPAPSVREAYEKGVSDALGRIASIGYGASEDVDRGHEEAYRAVEALLQGNPGA